MATVTRKQREIAEREKRILEVSRPMLIRDGYHGFSMDRIAEELDYSKGTIYNHFSCKEEVIIALAIETMEKRAEMFERGASFNGRSRERLLAIGMASELFVRIFPDHFAVENMMRISSIWEKTSETRRAVMRSCENRNINLVAEIVREAVAADDLNLPEGMSPEDIVFGLWSLTFGAYWIMATSDQLSELGIHEPFSVVRLNTSRILDGYSWLPLSTEIDHEQLLGRIGQEIFAMEIQMAQSK